MTAKRNTADRMETQRRTIVLERTYQAPVEDVWALWSRLWWRKHSRRVRALLTRVQPDPRG